MLLLTIFCSYSTQPVSVGAQEKQLPHTVIIGFAGQMILSFA